MEFCIRSTQKFFFTGETNVELFYFNWVYGVS